MHPRTWASFRYADHLSRFHFFVLSRDARDNIASVNTPHARALYFYCKIIKTDWKFYLFIDLIRELLLYFDRAIPLREWTSYRASIDPVSINRIIARDLIRLQYSITRIMHYSGT